MRSRSSITFALAALIVGIVIGGGGFAALYGRFTNHFFITSSATEAVTTVVILKQLRAGNTTNAVEILEMKLDEDLMTLGSFLDNPRDLKSDPHYIKTLQMARDYRIQFPHNSSSPLVDEATAKAFGLLDAQTGH
jgi:hypothetical protein